VECEILLKNWQVNSTSNLMRKQSNITLIAKCNECDISFSREIWHQIQSLGSELFLNPIATGKLHYRAKIQLLWSAINVSYIELRILKSSKLWSSQLWMQFKQLRIEAWNCLNCVHNCNDHSLLEYRCYSFIQLISLPTTIQLVALTINKWNAQAKESFKC